MRRMGREKRINFFFSFFSLFFSLFFSSSSLLSSFQFLMRTEAVVLSRSFSENEQTLVGVIRVDGMIFLASVEHSHESWRGLTA